MDVREHAAGGDRHAAEELVELLVVADREDEVARRLLQTDAVTACTSVTKAYSSS